MKENFKLMEEALIRERDKLLRKHPELIRFQLEIDNILDKLEDQAPEQRAQKLSEMLLEKVVLELLPANDELRKLQQRIKVLEEAA